MVQNFLIRLISTLAPVIHRRIVNTLANSETFQRIAWDGTEMAKKAAQDAVKKAKDMKILEEVPKQGAAAAQRARSAAAANANEGGLFTYLYRKFNQK
mmetsp:Transcript_37710/g.92688  ORF Transcript_37710/g.92688 Transcript_37710/m.92688 type:complete len:98 (-) Transcript_37710:169-462(-)